MAWYNPSTWRKGTKVTGFAEQDNTEQWFQYLNQYLNTLNGEVEKFDGSNSYELACNLAEIFIPIDAISERAASVKYVPTVLKTGEEWNPSPNVERLMNQPNPFDRFSDIIYKSVFSRLADGNSYIYTKTPESTVNPTYDNIANIWVLKPNVTQAKLYKQVPNPFLIKDKKELIEVYKTFFLYKHDILPRYIVHRTALGFDENMKSHSPLLEVRRNINNLLAVYHARYNVYAKNGNGGILSRAPQGQGAGSVIEAVDPVTRDQILTDIQNRNGLTGNKNFIGISSIPLQFIKTLGTINELEPFKETEADMITIGGIYGVDKYLLPISEGTTFTNKQDAEKGLWQNVIKGICNDEAEDMTKAFYLPEGVAFVPDFSTVEALQEDEKTRQERDSIYIDNLGKLRDMEQNVQQALTNITDDYNGR